MREILFRGKLIANGEWSYGNLNIKPGRLDIITPDETPLGKYGAVKSETVGQYTGFADTNGTKIFEGDILKFSVFDHNDLDAQYIGVVTYSGSRFMLWKSADSEYYGDDGGFDLDWVAAQDDEIEAIGNIHDNPELLEDKR